ncbi:hypothetical protein PC128_g19150 [Phytophthora cactorum]|nr:hypothetical protein PC128_g19150 [Phytophthora cactorum]
MCGQTAPPQKSDVLFHDRLILVKLVGDVADHRANAGVERILHGDGEFGNDLEACQMMRPWTIFFFSETNKSS